MNIYTYIYTSIYTDIDMYMYRETNILIQNGYLYMYV